MSDTHTQHSPLYLYAALTLWALGLLFSFTPLEAFETESYLLSVLCVFAAAVLGVASADEIDLKSALCSPVAAGLCAFWALVFISVGFSEIPFVSFIFACSFSALPLSFLLVTTRFKLTLRPIAYGLAALMAAMAAFSLVQFFALPDWLVFKLVHWPFANPNSLAGFYSLGFFCSIGWLLGGSSRAQSNIAMVLAVLCLWAILTTGSRAAVLAIVLIMPVFLYVARGAACKHRKCLGIVLAAGVLAFAAFGILGEVGQGYSATSVLSETLNGQQSLVSQRPAIWLSTLEIFKDHFWTGTGKGTFFLYYPEYRDGDVATAGIMAHNDPLQFAAEMGVFAPLVFYALLIFVLLRTIRAVGGIAAGDPKRLAILTPFFALAAFVMHAHVSFPFHSLPLLILSGGLLGFWFVQTGGFNRAAPLSKSAAYVVKAFCVFVLIGAGFVFARFQASEILVNRAQANMEAGQLGAFADEINLAGDLSSNMNARVLSEAASIPVGLLQFNGPFLSDEQQQDVYTQADGLLEKALRANPRLSKAYLLRGELKSYVEKLEPGAVQGLSAKEELERALRINPMDIRARLMLSDLYGRKGEQEAALEVLQDGLKWQYKRQNPQFYYERTKRLADELGVNVDVPSQ